MAACTYISTTQTVWNDTTSPKTTASISVEEGDYLIAFGATSSWQTSDAQTNNPTVSDSIGLTWTKQQEVAQNQYCGMVIYTAVAPSATSLTVTFTHVHTNTAIYNGGAVVVIRPPGLFSGSTIGTSVNGFGDQVVPSLNITTTYRKSLVLFFSADWNTNTNANRLWITANNYTPTSGNGYELIYNVAGNYTIYLAYYPNVGVVNTYSVGLLNPPDGAVLQKSSHVAIEIKGSTESTSDGGLGAGTGASAAAVSGVISINASSITL